MEAILEHEPAIRLGFFLGVFTVIAACEALAPRRQRALPRRVRWPGNLAIVALNTAILRVIFPAAAVGMALRSAEMGWGVLNLVALPAAAEVILAVVALDLAIYLQHVMMHAVPLLWRLHRMHHADLDVDVTTGTRFHPLEILLSMTIKLAVVALLGAPAVAVLIFEVLLNASSMFNHGNLRLPAGVDRALRWAVVTPDMHRVHHSIRPEETNSNFGFNLPWWDRLLGTYRAQPVDGHQAMTIGLDAFRAAKELRLDRMLAQPFRGTADRDPLERRATAAAESPASADAQDAGQAAGTWRRMALLGALAGAAGLAVFYRDAFDPARLEHVVAASGPWGPLIFIALFAAGTVLFLPGAAFALAGGALFGPVLGTVCNLAGATLGAVVAFLIARHGAADWVRGRTGPRLEQLVGGVEAEGWRFVAFVRLVPLFPFNLVNYAFGLTRVRLADYTLATAICMIPGGLAFTWLGYAGREAAAGAEGAIQKGLLGLGLLAVVLFLPRLVRRLKRRRDRRIAVDELERRLDAGDGILVLDVRDAADFTGDLGHVPGARNVPLSQLEARLGELQAWRQRPLAVLCRTDKRTVKAVALLRERGFAGVVAVEGGMVEWTRRRLPVEGRP